MLTNRHDKFLDTLREVKVCVQVWRDDCGVFSPLNILDPKSGLFYSSAKFSFVSNTNFPSTVETGMVLWDSNVDVLCKDSRITFSYGRK